MKLLLVEDEPALLDELETYLGEQGHLCERAASFHEAEDKILLYHYDAEVCLSNLLANALHYIPEGGALHITLQPHALLLCNSGAPLSFPAIQLFDRFKKGEQHMLTNGLGLSIVQQICLLNHWSIHYNYQQSQHEFRILFPI